MARMKYLVIATEPTTGERVAFYTDWFDADNHFNGDADMVAIDLIHHLVTFDGETWQDIEQDHL
ncbi:MAG: hypothetical protein NC401_04065 [Ruminococcus sp.]|nr:hypothetical protein [Ruminococcus sp.]